MDASCLKYMLASRGTLPVARAKYSIRGIISFALRIFTLLNVPQWLSGLTQVKQNGNIDAGSKRIKSMYIIDNPLTASL